VRRNVVADFVETRAAARREAILRRWLAGASQKDLAVMYRVSATRLRQLLEAARARPWPGRAA